MTMIKEIKYKLNLLDVKLTETFEITNLTHDSVM